MTTHRSWATLIVFGSLLAGPAAAQKSSLKLASLVPQGSAWHTTLQEMGAEWEKLSGGRVSLRLYPGGVAGDDSDVVRKMRLGTLDAGLLSVSGLSNIDRAVNVLTLPMFYASVAEFDAVLAALAPEFARLYEAKGFVVLAWADGGIVRLFAKSAVRTPAELATQKIFTWAGDGPTVELWKAAGFNPVPLPATEISTALQTGLVTALPTTAQAAILLQWYQHAKFMTDLAWGVLPGAIVVTKASWEKVPAELRPQLAEAARQAAAKLSTQTRSGARADLDAMVKRGLTIVPVDVATAAAWQRAAESAYPRARDYYAPGVLIDSAAKARDAFRAAAKGSG